jgi:hypothetical protein
MRRHQFEIGEMVYWSFDGKKALPFDNCTLYLGIVTNITKKADGVEVFWFNNHLFKLMNYDSLLKVEKCKSTV